MKAHSDIVHQIEIPISALPDWDQFPPVCRNELIQALAELLLSLPQLQMIEPMQTAPRVNHEHWE